MFLSKILKSTMVDSNSQPFFSREKTIDSQRAAEGAQVFNFSKDIFCVAPRQGLIKIENWADDSEMRSAGTVDWTDDSIHAKITGLFLLQHLFEKTEKLNKRLINKSRDIEIVCDTAPIIRNINIKLASEDLFFVVFFCENWISVEFDLMFELARIFVHPLLDLDALKLAKNCFKLDLVVKIRSSICCVNS